MIEVRVPRHEFDKLTGELAHQWQLRRISFKVAPADTGEIDLSFAGWELDELVAELRAHGFAVIAAREAWV